MKILITGARGLLGNDLNQVLSCCGSITAVDIQDFDVADELSCVSFIEHLRPDWVVHAAAFAQVDACESNEQLAFRVNSTGTANVARACAATGAKLIYYSTDYVFDGTSSRPYEEDDPVNPMTVYGKSKLAGETQVARILSESRFIVVRTSWLYGINGKNFVDTIVQKARSIPELRIVNDQQGCPTFSRDLAQATAALIEKNAHGIVHVSNTGVTTWYDFARYFLSLLKITTPLHPVSSDSYPLPAKRPQYSALSNNRFAEITSSHMPHWQDAVKRYLKIKYGFIPEKETIE